MTTPTAARLLGAPIPRKEDPRLISGGATYVADIKLPGTLHLAVLRSPYAHARIRSVALSRARAMPGVIYALDGQETKPLGTIFAGFGGQNLKVPEHFMLCWDKARLVGDPVAAVVATDRYLAEDALGAIEVDYEPLAAAVDPEAALEEGAPLVHEQFGTNLGQRITVRLGDVERAFAEADVVVTATLEQQRLAPVFMENRGILADYRESTGELTMWLATQGPHGVRQGYAKFFGLPDQRVRVIAPEVGGGFGAKVGLYAEELLAAYLSRKLGRPVQWIEDRRENLLTTMQGRDQRHYVEVACKRDGVILGFKDRLVADFGAYLQGITAGLHGSTTRMLSGCYSLQGLEVEVYGAYTNKMSIGAYRGAGRPEAAFVVERIADLVAAELGLDPAEVRRRNFIPPESFPFTTITGCSYDSGEYQRALDLALEMAGYKDFRERQRRERLNGRLIGVGLSSYVEVCGGGAASFGNRTGPFDTATIRMEPSGALTIFTGTSPHGQGHETTWAQIAADELGVAFEDVTVRHGDTNDGAFGAGTFGSRSAATGGTAVLLAARGVREKLVKLAADKLEAHAEDVVLENGLLYVRGSRDISVSVGDMAKLAYSDVLPDAERGLEATAIGNPRDFVYPYGCHLCEVEVDAGTGGVKILRYIAVDDAGNIINPLVADGQVHGGLAQGIAQALYEEVLYDPESGQPLTASLMDYEIPTAADLPDYETEVVVTPTDRNPLGVKGVGEAGTIGGTPAVTNAVIDALSHLGVRNITIPLTPEKVWRAMGSARPTPSPSRTGSTSAQSPNPER